MRIALAQVNPTVGDIAGNTRLIREAMDRARKAGAQALAVPELAVPGYPPEDLLFKKSFVRANLEAVEDIAAQTNDLLLLVGFVDYHDEKIYNAAAICHGGRILDVYHKHCLPNYGVFDERRYFEPGRGLHLVDTDAGVIGICICEDVWFPEGPAGALGEAGAQIVVCLNASPFHKDKLSERTEMLADRARRGRATIAYVNAIGGQDELVFDGGSIVVDPEGSVIARLPQFHDAIGVADVEPGPRKELSTGDDVTVVSAQLPRVTDKHQNEIAGDISFEEEIYDALELALADYTRKNGFDKVVIGLSGGIDSTVTATIATDALGPDAVLGVAMPSHHSTSHSVADAKELAANLGIEMLEIAIAKTYNAYADVLEESFGEVEPALAEENLQARIRGNILMAISNRYGHLVLATGNKSEMACGYATLYGDMAGGFALLKDVFKTEVYALARYRNSISPVIPENVLTKPPSAELRPDQKDEDSLPRYEILDPILEAYIEDDADLEEIVARGYDEDTVRDVIRLVDYAEYKRRQAPPGPKVTSKAFGRDRRLPITNAWRT